MDPKARAKAEFFASARAGVRREDGPPETGWADRYFPTLGGKFVRPSGMPKDGYERRGQALTGARAFKQACRDAVAKRASRDPLPSQDEARTQQAKPVPESQEPST